MGELNLIPQEVKFHEELKIKRIKTTLLVTSAVLLFIFINFILVYYIYMRDMQNKTLESDIAKMAFINTETDKISAMNKTIQERLKVLNYIYRDEKKWAEIIREISSILPAGVCVNYLDASSENISMQCRASSQREIAVLTANLENSNRYSLIRVNEIVPEGSAFGFSISFKLKDT